jgi:hypothetical protein
VTPIRPQDLVRLRHTPAWTAVVVTTDDDLGLVLSLPDSSCVVAWVPVDLVELVPGQTETMAA